MDSPPSRTPPAKTYHRIRERSSRALGGVAFSVAIVGAFLRWKPFRVAIEGASMAPALLPGDWALAVSARRLRRGDVVVVEHPGRPGFEIVKRIVGVPGDRVDEAGPALGPDDWWVQGDHAEGSTDS